MVNLDLYQFHDEENNRHFKGYIRNNEDGSKFCVGYYFDYKDLDKLEFCTIYSGLWHDGTPIVQSTDYSSYRNNKFFNNPERVVKYMNHLMDYCSTLENGSAKFILNRVGSIDPVCEWTFFRDYTNLFKSLESGRAFNYAIRYCDIDAKNEEIKEGKNPTLDLKPKQ